MSDDNTQEPKKEGEAAPAAASADPTGPDLTDVQNAEDTPPPPAAAAPAPRAPLGDVSLDSVLSREAQKANPQEAKKNVKQVLYGGIGVVLLIIVMMVYSCQPREGSMAYGICSTYLELNTPYPHTIKYNDLEGSRTAVRIYYSGVDPFGEYKQEMIECTFGPDEVMGMKLTEIKRNRRPVDAEEVKKFNMLLPTIIASNPYRVMPPDWKNPLLYDEAPMYEIHPLPRLDN